MKLPARLREQASAVPFRFGETGLEILLVTSISSGAWILPKGLVDPGNTPARAAEIEALEEAGVIGSACPEPVAVYEFDKGVCRIRMQVFSLRVEQVLETWLECKLRRRRWVSVDEAKRLVEDPRIRLALDRFVDSLQDGE